ncbi:MAG: hypothetical protein RIT03_1989 [Bacteroidota bacterium]|jgi:hypothetical protein
MFTLKITLINSKRIVYLTILFIGFFSCSKSDSTTSNPSIVGKWKQTELFTSNGGSSPAWQTVANGYEIELLSNGTFTSTKNSECATGTFSLSATNDLNMTYNCAGFTNSYVEKVETITDSQLILRPTYLNCDEGCSVKFEKVN